MIKEEKVLVFDIDGTICSLKQENESYADVQPNHQMISKIKEYRAKGFYIILCTSRNMRTYQGNIGKINAHTLKDLFIWLEKYDVPHDEIHVGKPWAGHKGFYIDDRAVRPSEFLSLSEEELQKLIGVE